MRAVFEVLSEPRGADRIVEQFWTPRPLTSEEASSADVARLRARDAR